MGFVGKLVGAVCVVSLVAGCGSMPKPDAEEAASPTVAQPSPSPSVSDVEVRAAIRAGLSAGPISERVLREALTVQVPAASPAQVTGVLATMHIDWNNKAMAAAKGALRGTTGTTPWLLQHALVSAGKFTPAQAAYAVGHLDVDWKAQAIKGFQHILDTGKGWSRSGLIRHVIAVDHYRRDLANYAADNVTADWNRQAVKAARASSAYSRAGVLRTLARSGFTADEAVFAAEALGYYTVAQQNAVASAKQYLRLTGFSRQGLIDQLDSSYGAGFSVADATFGVDHIKVDWNAQAVRSARAYLKLQPFSRVGLIGQLSSAYGGKFTYAQAVYAANHVGL